MSHSPAASFLSADRTRPQPLRIFGVPQLPGPEDLPDALAPPAHWLSLTGERRLGDLQGPQWQALLLQPHHAGKDLEAAPNQRRQHREHQRKQAQHGGELRGKAPRKVGTN